MRLGILNRCAAIAALSTLLVASPAKSELNCNAIEVVVPYSAGAFADALGRLFANRLISSSGKRAIVVNRPGGATIPATLAVVNAKPDGCTILLVGMATFTSNPTLQRGKLPYESMKDLAPISVLAASSALMMVNPSLGVESASALIELAKRKPGTVNYASPGIGSNPHLAMEYFKSITGADFVHVPYRGLAPATTDLLANHVQLLFSSPAGFEGHIREGRLKALGVTGTARLKALPDVPLFSEVGYAMPELDHSSSFGLMTSARVPEATVKALAAIASEAVRDQKFAADVEKLGLRPIANSPEEFRSVINEEIQRWGDLIRKVGIQAD